MLRTKSKPITNNEKIEPNKWSLSKNNQLSVANKCLEAADNNFSLEEIHFSFSKTLDLEVSNNREVSSSKKDNNKEEQEGLESILMDKTFSCDHIFIQNRENNILLKYIH